MYSVSWFRLAVLVPSFVLSSAAFAQEQVNAEFFRPVPGDGYLGVGGALPLSDLQFRVGMFLNFADDPVVLVQNSDGEQVARLVGSQSAADVIAALGFGNRFELGIAMPFALFQQGDTLNNFNAGQPVTSLSLGDLRFSAKVRVIGPSTKRTGFFV